MLSYEFKVLPSGADLKAKEQCNQNTAQNHDRPKAKFKYTFPGAAVHTPNLHSCFRCCSTALPGSSVSGYTGSSLSLVLFAHSTRLQMTQSATCPRTSQLLTPPRPSTHLRVRTHTRTHTCPHTPSPRLRPAGGLGLGEPGTASAGWVVPGAAAPPALSARTPSLASSVQTPRGRRGSPKTRRPRRLPLRGEASAFLTATVSPEPRNSNRARRGGRGGSSF